MSDPQETQAASEYETDDLSEIGDNACCCCLESELDLIDLPCPEHSICRPCLEEIFTRALKNKSDWPVTCCNRKDDNGKDYQIPLIYAAAFMSEDFVHAYAAKEEEYQTSRPVYCAGARCSAFLPPRMTDDGKVICPECGWLTCMICRRFVDEEKTSIHTCSDIRDEKEDYKEFKDRYNVKPCPECAAPIEHTDACNHMHCEICDTDFCFFCCWFSPCNNECPRYGLPQVDEEGWTKDYIDPDGHFWRGGFHKDTGLDREGYNHRGYNWQGINRDGVHRNDVGEAFHQTFDVGDAETDDVDDDGQGNGGGDVDWGNNDQDEHDHDDQQGDAGDADDWALAQWRAQNWLLDADIDWDNLPFGAKAEHEEAQMRYDIENGLFVVPARPHEDVGQQNENQHQVAEQNAEEEGVAAPTHTGDESNMRIPRPMQTYPSELEGEAEQGAVEVESEVGAEAWGEVDVVVELLYRLTEPWGKFVD